MTDGTDGVRSGSDPSTPSSDDDFELADVASPGAETAADADPRATLAAAFDTTVDPLASSAATFDSLVDVDPFEVFVVEVLDEREPAHGTRQGYRRAIEQWRTYMHGVGRHPACPTAAHVRGFARHRQRVHGNRRATIMTKLHRLDTIYQYWQADPVFPQPADYNPFQLASASLDLEREPTKDHHHLSLAVLRDQVRDVTHVRDRAVIVVQLKLGLRATEVSNLRVGDLHLTDEECTRWYAELGTHPQVRARPNSVYVATRAERDGNKSTRPRVLPVDAELQRVLDRWLLVRPQVACSSLFLTKQTHRQLPSEDVNRVWRAAFHPEYAATDAHRAITSHYGRHRFTTYWRVDQELPRELVQYMRGDALGNATDSSALAESRREAIDEYLHAYYEDIEGVYREQMYQLGV